MCNSVDKKRLFLILLIIGTVFWGVSFPVTKLSMGNYSQTTFLFYRFLIATILLSLIFRKHLKRVNLRVFKTSISFALPLVFGIFFQTLGVKHGDANQCAFIAGMCVVIIPLLKTVFYKQNIAFRIWVAAFLALIGLGVISITERLSVNIGDIYTMIGAFGFSVYLIKIERYSKKENVLPTISPMFMVCTLITFILSLFDTNANWMPQNQTFWMGIAFCAMLPTAYMYGWGGQSEPPSAGQTEHSKLSAQNRFICV
ncbi:DMT family transporter [Formosa sp. A9]|uniref:DMT family transporter n=1 Tax=Formosa sp. A9 TaxID=3442641 RepID=UPI003EBFF8C5